MEVSRPARTGQFRRQESAVGRDQPHDGEADHDAFERPLDEVAMLLVGAPPPCRGRRAISVATLRRCGDLALDLEFLATDTMSTLPTTGPRAFQDQTVACGDTQARACKCGPDQNSFALLTERLGNSDATPPLVTITSPGDGESVSPGFKVVVAATDNLSVRSVTLMIDGVRVGALTSPPYEFTTPSTIPDGQHIVKAIASDGKNEGNHVTYVTVKAAMTTPPGDGGGCAATSGGGFGAALAAAVGLWRKRRPRC